MLTSLSIENFAIVAHLELDCSPGMSAFTGETGAGKSILIDALMLALGGRAEASVIRAGADKCDITAQFHTDTPEPIHWLELHDVSNHQGEIFLRRVIFPEGRSKCFINGQPFPQQKVKELSEMLVDIHGQHQHQRLLQHATHRQQLDEFAAHEHLLDDVSRLYRECQALREAIESTQPMESTRERLTLLDYQLDELSRLAPQAGEIDTLHEEHQLLHHAVDYLEKINQVTELLNGDDQPAICNQLHQVSQLLQALPEQDPRLNNARELLNTALIQCEEVQNEVHQFAAHVHVNPSRLSEIEERLSQLHQVARKYQMDVRQLPLLLDQLQQERERLQISEQEVATQQQRYQEQLNAYHQAALALRHSRETHAPKLAAEISRTMQQLGMPNGVITLEFTPLEKPHNHGLDKIEYKVCTNPGMPMDYLNRVASGGELSRISLAIQLITAQKASTPTLLFDEVDVGIGGATAALVGSFLRQLGERLQVFCVTHQPQVASCAHNHFRVEKHTDKKQTYSTITTLSTGDKIDEIARMLGGLVITEQTRSNARELLEQSHFAVQD